MPRHSCLAWACMGGGARASSTACFWALLSRTRVAFFLQGIGICTGDEGGGTHWCHPAPMAFLSPCSHAAPMAFLSPRSTSPSLTMGPATRAHQAQHRGAEAHQAQHRGLRPAGTPSLECRGPQLVEQPSWSVSIPPSQWQPCTRTELRARRDRVSGGETYGGMVGSTGGHEAMSRHRTSV